MRCHCCIKSYLRNTILALASLSKSLKKKKFITCALGKLNKDMDLSSKDYESTVEVLRAQVEELSLAGYAKNYEIERLKIELNKSCSLMEVCNAAYLCN